MKLNKYYLHILALLFASITLAGCGAVDATSSTDSLSNTNGTGSTGTGVGYGTASLSWTPPTVNTDGSTLTNLAGYKIYYGTSSGKYTNTITINNPGITDYIVENLLSGNTYYFVITAFDSNGLTSTYSGEGHKAI